MPLPDFPPQDPYAGAGNYAQTMLAKAMRLGVLPRQRLVGMDAKSLADLWRQKSGDVASMGQAQGFTDPRAFLQAKQQGFQGPVAYNINPNPNASSEQSLAGAQSFASGRLNSVMSLLPQLQGTAVGGLLEGGIGGDPLAKWREVSAALAQQAQGQGYMDPRVYLASLLARRPGATGPKKPAKGKGRPQVKANYIPGNVAGGEGSFATLNPPGTVVVA